MEDMAFDLRIAAIESNFDYYLSQAKFIIAASYVEREGTL